MKIRFHNIKWDTDGEDVDLPTETTLEVDDDIDVSLQGADALSDKFNWCVLSFEWEQK